jgi:hypothetical protein
MRPALQNSKFWQIDLAGISACLIMLGLLILCGLWPLAKKHAAYNKQNITLAKEQDEVSAAQAEVFNMERKLDICRRSLAGSVVSLSRVGALNAQMSRLSALAEEVQLKVNETTSGKPVPTEHYVIVPIKLSGSGSYDKCTRFLHKLRQSFPDTGLDSMELTGNPDGTGLFMIQLRWYASSNSGEGENT